jgi:hypothetical protein
MIIQKQVNTLIGRDVHDRDGHKIGEAELPDERRRDLD